MDTFNLFILFPKDVLSEVITDEDSYQGYLNQISDLINRADCEKGAILFYDNSEYQAFANALDELAYAGEFYLIKPRRILNALLKQAIDWTENEPKQFNNCFYALWDSNSFSVVQEIPPSVKEAFEYQCSQDESKQLVLNLDTGFFPHKKALFIFKDRSNHDNQELPIFIKLNQVCNSKSLDEWLMNNRTPRQLNVTDQRHNEHSTLYIKGKSPILYDLGRDNTAIAHIQDLLNKAITDQYESKDLMNYDPTKEKYIWFEYENDNPQNQYHAYHLAKPTTHESDLSAIAKIPQRAKRFIDKRTV
jgi:hypothetical protein